MGVDAADEIEPGIKKELLSGSIKPTDTAVAAIAKADPDARPALVEQLRQPKQLSDKTSAPVQEQVPTEIEPSSITDDEAQPESEQEEAEHPTRPMTEIQKSLRFHPAWKLRKNWQMKAPCSMNWRMRYPP